MPCDPNSDNREVIHAFAQSDFFVLRSWPDDSTIASPARIMDVSRSSPRPLTRCSQACMNPPCSPAFPGGVRGLSEHLRRRRNLQCASSMPSHSSCFMAAKVPSTQVWRLPLHRSGQSPYLGLIRCRKPMLLQPEGVVWKLPVDSGSR